MTVCVLLPTGRSTDLRAQPQVERLDIGKRISRRLDVRVENDFDEPPARELVVKSAQLRSDCEQGTPTRYEHARTVAGRHIEHDRLELELHG